MPSKGPKQRTKRFRVLGPSLKQQVQNLGLKFRALNSGLHAHLGFKILGSMRMIVGSSGGPEVSKCANGN